METLVEADKQDNSAVANVARELGDVFNVIVQIEVVPVPGEWEVDAVSGHFKLSKALRGRQWYYDDDPRHLGYYFNVVNENEIVTKNIDFINEMAEMIDWNDLDLERSQLIAEDDDEQDVLNEDSESFEEDFAKFEKAIIDKFKALQKGFQLPTSRRLTMGFWMTDEDKENIPGFDPTKFMTEVPQEETGVILDAIHQDVKNQEGWENAAAQVLGRPLESGEEFLKFGATLRHYLDKMNVKEVTTADSTTLTIGNAVYSKRGDTWSTNKTATAEQPLETVLKRANWAALLSAATNDLAKERTAEEGSGNQSILDPRAERIGTPSQRDPVSSEYGKDEEASLQGPSLRFTKAATKRLDETSVQECLKKAETFFSTVLTATAEDWKSVIVDSIPQDAARALAARAGALGLKETGQLHAEIIEAFSSLNADKFTAYCDSLAQTWQAFGDLPTSVVIDDAGLKDVFGKTPEDKQATPERLMAMIHAQLPQNPLLLVNASADDMLTTIAHELAHVIGFNPTGCDPNGHFAEPRRYLELEECNLPKLFFDAYYFETIFPKLMATIQNRQVMN